MNPFADVRADAAAKLVAAGVTVATTNAAANVPFVLVDAVTVEGASGVGAWSALMTVRIVVPGPGDAAALGALEEYLTVVLVTLGGAPAIPETYGPTELPAYTVIYPVSVNNPNC